MSYQVLARKYRPLRFTDVVGQEHVTKTLTHAIERDRIHHAYLFTGVRGTGKTSLARLFAMALNCESGPKIDFDPNSDNGLAIQKGQFLDVIEIDGASNTSVDAVRELREQIKYMPAAGKYKVYIIDEVHMLSTSAFNALLKTLEEPPEHVVFLFATTESHKIPVTILSRCQRFDLKRLSQVQILTRLQWICEQENMPTESGALEMIARAAEGSMRDAQSLLDMAIGMAGETLSAPVVEQMLGWVDAPFIEQLTQHCLQNDLSAGLAQIQELYGRGYDLRQVVMQWIDYFHDLILLKTAGSQSLAAEWTEEQTERMKTLIRNITLADLQIAFQQVYQASEQIFRSDTPKILLDLLLVKLVHGAPFQPLGQILAGNVEMPTAAEAPTTPAAAPLKPAPPPQAAPPKMDEVSASPPPPPKPAPSPAPTAQAPMATNGDAKALLEKVLSKQPQIKAVVEHAVAISLNEDKLRVAFDKASLWVDMFQEKRDVVAKLLSEALAKPIQVLIEEQKTSSASPKDSASAEDEPVLPEDPMLREAVEVLGATVKEVRKL